MPYFSMYADAGQVWIDGCPASTMIEEIGEFSPKQAALYARLCEQAKHQREHVIETILAEEGPCAKCEPGPDGAYGWEPYDAGDIADQMCGGMDEFWDYDVDIDAVE